MTLERLTVVSARQIIKARARAAGVEGFISGHSLRVGSAVLLAQARAPVIDMQNAGRWKSPQMSAHYAKASVAERGQWLDSSTEKESSNSTERSDC